MERENKKAAIAALHRSSILAAAERLFIKKGFSTTTIDDISKQSGYSRRTIYSYYESKEDLFYHCIEQGLIVLKENISSLLAQEVEFLRRYALLCSALQAYQTNCPLSMDSVVRARPQPTLQTGEIKSAQRLFTLGNEINQLLEGFICDGIAQGAVRQTDNPMAMVYVVWSSLSALLTLAETKEPVLTQLNMTKERFLTFGFTQVLQSIAREPD